MAKNLILGLVLVHFGPNLGPNFCVCISPMLEVRHSCKLSLHAKSMRKRQKLVSGLILTHLAQIQADRQIDIVIS